MRILTGIKHKIYGGLILVFAGDMFQLKPVNGKALYEDAYGDNDLYWKCCITRVVYLENNHRFRDNT